VDSRLIGWETEVGSNADGVIRSLSDLGYPVDGSGGYDYEPSYYCNNCDNYLSDDICDCDDPDVVDDNGGEESSSGYLHEYHCSCNFCDAYPERSNFFHYQMDCTVDGEIITKPTPWLSPNTDTAIRDLSYALITNGSRTSGNVGNHVHVDIRDLTHPQMVLLWQLYLKYQDDFFEPIARGAQRYVREYNVPLKDFNLYKNKEGKTTFQAQYYDRDARDINDWLGVYTSNTPLEIMFTQVDYKNFEAGEDFFYAFDGGAWLSHHGNTAEFRLWNASRSPFRLRLYTALSAALVDAARDEVDINAGWENNVLARLTTKQQTIYEYHTTRDKPALPSGTGSRVFWEPLNERRCGEADAAEYRLSGYDVHEIKDIRTLVLS
jgi:hypothetical protein